MKWDPGLFCATEILSDHIPGKSLQWLGSDTLENYKSERAQINARGFTDTSITYTLNELGFRSDNFEKLLAKTDSLRILVSGCSHTFGIGNRLQETWPVILSNKIFGASLFNIALGGQSPDYVVRSIYRTVATIKPDIIAVLWPSEARFEFPRRGDSNCTFSPMHYQYPVILADDLYQDYCLAKNKCFLKTLADAHGAKLLSIDNREFMELSIPGDLGRDLHFGPRTHARLANHFYQQYLELSK